MPFDFKNLDLPGLALVQPRVYRDDRGFFAEIFKHSDFAEAGIKERFVQDNYSRSARGVLRGLHYQKNPKAQGKLVTCLTGRILDVAVDIRKGSPHYAKWTGVELSGENHAMLYVPQGFAHGFLVLSEFAEVLYKCTEEYSPADDRGIIWSDPEINIKWPDKKPVLSEKDAALPLLKNADADFTY